MKILFALIVLMLCGCTRVAVNRPLGVPITLEEAKRLAGTWTGAKGEEYVVTVDDGNLPLLVEYVEDSKPKNLRGVVTLLNSEVPVLWLRDSGLDAFIFCRVCMIGEGGLSLLFPDDEEVKRFVAEGSLSGRYDEKSRSWILDQKGLERSMSDKQLWRMDAIMPFLKKTK